MIIGTGIDIVDLGRIALAIDRHGERFVERIMTLTERRAFGNKNRLIEYVGGRFAAKEATMKALGRGLGLLWWHDIVVVPSEFGRPTLQLSEHGKQVAGLQGDLVLHLSISHCPAFAVAHVVVENWTAKP